MRKPGALAFLCLTIGVLDCGRANPSATTGGQGDTWEITVTAKSHTHDHGSSTSGNEEKLNDADVTYTLALTQRLQGSATDGQIDLGEDTGEVIATPAASGSATEVSHNRHAIMSDLQEQWIERKGVLDPPPSGGGVHFGWDGKAHQGMFEATTHYTGTQTSREHVVDVSNKVDRTDSHSDKWVQSAMFGGDAKHPVTVKQNGTGWVVDWTWTETTRDPSGATKEIDQSGHAEIRPYTQR